MNLEPFSRNQRLSHVTTFAFVCQPDSLLPVGKCWFLFFFFWSWLCSPTLRAGLTLLSGGDTKTCRATQQLEMATGKPCCSAAPLPQAFFLWPSAHKVWLLAGAEEHVWSYCACGWNTCSSASRELECECCQDDSPALPWPLAGFGASSSNWV